MPSAPLAVTFLGSAVALQRGGSERVGVRAAAGQPDEPVGARASIRTPIPCGHTTPRSSRGERRVVLRYYIQKGPDSRPNGRGIGTGWRFLASSGTHVGEFRFPRRDAEDIADTGPETKRAAEAIHGRTANAVGQVARPLPPFGGGRRPVRLRILQRATREITPRNEVINVRQLGWMNRAIPSRGDSIFLGRPLEG